MLTATKQDLDDLKSQVSGIADLVKRGKTEYQDNIQAAIKSALENHPGFTPKRKVDLGEGNKAMSSEREVLESMPNELQKEIDNVLIVSTLLKKKPNQLKMWGGVTKRMGDFKKALDTAASGGGSEWIPTEFTPQLQELIRLETRVAALFPEIPMPSNPYTLPIQIGRLTSFKQPEQTADTGQTKIPVGDTANITSSTTFTAVGHATRVLTSKDLEEDSIIPILPFLQSEIVRVLAEGREDCILNGDTAGTHEDSDISSADDRRKMFLGLRAMAHDQSYTADMATFTAQNIIDLLRTPMGKYGVNPADLALITGPKGYGKMLTMDEVMTLDKYGPNAVVLSGELGRVFGIPIIVSEWVREILNTLGVYNVSGSKTAVYLVHRRAFAVGFYRRPVVRLLQELYAESDQDALLSRERIDFQPIHPIASNKTVYLGQNVG